MNEDIIVISCFNNNYTLAPIFELFTIEFLEPCQKLILLNLVNV